MIERPSRPASVRRAWWTVVAFAVWTLLVWATRVDNVWIDEGLDTAGRVSRIALAGSFMAFATLTLVWAWRDRRRGLRAGTVLVLGPFVGWTVAVWLVRGAGIVLDDHEVAFKVVHSALAAVSIGLGLAVLGSLRRAGRQPSSLHPPVELSAGGGSQTPVG